MFLWLLVILAAFSFAAMLLSLLVPNEVKWATLCNGGVTTLIQDVSNTMDKAVQGSVNLAFSSMVPESKGSQ